MYQTLFNDHLGEYLRQEEPPTDPRKLKREHLTGRMLHLQPAPEDGGTGQSGDPRLPVLGPICDK